MDHVFFLVSRKYALQIINEAGIGNITNITNR